MFESNTEYKDSVAFTLFEVMKRDGGILTNSEIYSRVSDALNLPEEEKSKKYHKSGIYIYQNHIQFGLLGLKVMGMVNHVARGRWSISQKCKEKNNLVIEEISNYQRSYWNKQNSKKRKSRQGKQSPLSQDSLFGNGLSETKKEQLLSEILEQNKRILDYIMGKK